MSNNHKPTPKDEHGRTGPYIIGFALSLIFTIIPYHLVVNEVMSGNALLFTILGIALWQMVIQLVFFLHLGRGPKPLYNLVFFFGTAGIIVLTIGASLFIMDNLYKNMSPNEVILKQAQEENIAQIGGKDTGACKEHGEQHEVTISGGLATPSVIQANLCDTLSFVNKDAKSYELGFGAHPDDISYGGDYTVVLDDRRAEIITLNQAGEFTFHGHENPSLTGFFSVSP